MKTVAKGLKDLFFVFALGFLGLTLAAGIAAADPIPQGVGKLRRFPQPCSVRL